jgi:hypothetical protein
MVFLGQGVAVQGADEDSEPLQRATRLNETKGKQIFQFWMFVFGNT